MKNISISQNFKRSAQKAILSIIFFVVTYIVLVVLAIGFTIACGYGGIMLIALKPSLLTLMLGLGAISIGLLILFFMVKFIFAKNTTDRSNLLEIKREEEPKLFAFVEDIVNETGTDFPKKIYISSEVNASVFYDSSFWSMFLPVKKNLHLGVGLMNTVTVDEFKGIVAHEFGHFSQRSMKVGSYVYNVNYILHNMLYDNASYDAIIGKWANLSGYFSLAAVVGVKIISGIQWVLKQVYEVVNLNYLALSREMEFHADEVAANVAGSQALATSLVRMDLAAHAYNNTLNFYSTLIKENKKPDNIFPQMGFILSYWGNEFKLPVANGLPQPTLTSKTRFNKSKLSFDDQWSSHPSDKDRIKKLDELNIPVKAANTSIATVLFADAEKTEQRVTSRLFAEVPYTAATTAHAITEFKPDFLNKIQKNAFDKKYNNYFDDQSLSAVNFDDLPEISATEKELFSQQAVDSIYYSIGLKNDIATLNQIVNKEFKVNSFDYDEQRYKASDASELIRNAEAKLEEVTLQIEQHNKQVFAYYYQVAKKANQSVTYLEKYSKYADFEKAIEKEIEILTALYNSTSFTRHTCSFEIIRANMQKVHQCEESFKASLRRLLENEAQTKTLDEETKEIFTKYVTSELVYFSNETYNEEALGLLFDSMSLYNNALNDILFMYKKEFLDFQASLTESKVVTTDEKQILN